MDKKSVQEHSVASSVRLSLPGEYHVFQTPCCSFCNAGFLLKNAWSPSTGWDNPDNVISVIFWLYKKVERKLSNSFHRLSSTPYESMTTGERLCDTIKSSRTATKRTFVVKLFCQLTYHFSSRSYDDSDLQCCVSSRNKILFVSPPLNFWLLFACEADDLVTEAFCLLHSIQVALGRSVS